MVSNRWQNVKLGGVKGKGKTLLQSRNRARIYTLAGAAFKQNDKLARSVHGCLPQCVYIVDWDSEREVVADRRSAGLKKQPALKLVSQPP